MTTTSPPLATHPTATESWTPDQAAEYAAKRDFRLIKLLANDRRALATARRLGVFTARQAWRGEATAAKRSAPRSVPTRCAAVQTMSDPNGDATLTSKQRRSSGRRDTFMQDKRGGDTMDVPPPERADAGAQVNVGAAEMATQTNADAQAEADALREQLLEPESWRAKLKRAAKHWKVQYEKTRGELEKVSQQQQQQQQQQQADLQQQQQQPPQPQSMDDERAPKRAHGSTSPSSAATRTGADYAAAARGTGGGEGARIPPSKKGLFLGEAAKEERRVLEEASDTLAAKGGGRGTGRGKGDGRGGASGGGRGGASSSGASSL